MKRTKFKRTRISINDSVEFNGGYYHDTGVVKEIKSPLGYPHNRLIFVAWDHNPNMNPMEGSFGAVAEKDLRRILQKS